MFRAKTAIIRINYSNKSIATFLNQIILKDFL